MSRPPRLGRVVALTALCVCVSGLAACGIGDDARPTIIPSDELPPDLANTTTTTTTTTVPLTVPPTSTQLTVPAQSTATMTTMPPIETVLVRAYFVPSGTEEIVRPVDVPRARASVGAADLLNLLENPTPQLSELGLTTAVRAGLVTGVNVEELGRAWVNLDGSLFDQMADVRQRQAIAQIVLTLTVFTSDRGPIESVVFTVNGEAIPVILPAAGSTSPGEPVGFYDFQSWIEDAAAGPTTTTTAPPAPPTVPSTASPSVPPADPADPATTLPAG